jgi:hypothetical protein
MPRTSWGLVLTDDGLQRIAIDRERIRTFIKDDASRRLRKRRWCVFPPRETKPEAR